MRGSLIFLPLASANGLLAQLVERLNGIEEVRSSSLLGSTILAAAVPFGSAAVFLCVGIEVAVEVGTHLRGVRDTGSRVQFKPDVSGETSLPAQSTVPRARALSSSDAIAAERNQAALQR